MVVDRDVKDGLYRDSQASMKTLSRSISQMGFNAKKEISLVNFLSKPKMSLPLILICAYRLFVLGAKNFIQPESRTSPIFRLIRNNSSKKTFHSHHSTESEDDNIPSTRHFTRAKSKILNIVMNASKDNNPDQNHCDVSRRAEPLHQKQQES
jgi:hypothetical protein